MPKKSRLPKKKTAQNVHKTAWLYVRNKGMEAKMRFLLYNVVDYIVACIRLPSSMPYEQSVSDHGGRARFRI